MSNKTSTHDDWWEPKEFSEDKDIGLNQVYSGIHSGQIPSIKIGGRYYIPKLAWRKLLAGEGQAA